MLHSAFFRELQEYSRNSIIDKLQLPAEIADRVFCRLLRSGILKLRQKNADLGSREELFAQDFENTETEIAPSEPRYFFNYVGIIELHLVERMQNDVVLKCYPKFFHSDPSIEKMRIIMETLRKYHNSEQFPISIAEIDNDRQHYNQLAVILYLLQDYFSNGIYSGHHNVLEFRGQGEIDWDVTINETFPILKNGRPYYIDYYTNQTEDDTTGFITRLHQCVLTECSRQLRATELDKLFGIETIDLYDGMLDELGDVTYIQERILKELNVQFVTQKQQLLRCLYAFVSKEAASTVESPLSLFGTNAFNLVWEKACAEIFGSQLDKRLDQLGIELSANWKEKGDILLRDIIAKPIWTHYDSGNTMKTETLRPDFVAITEYNGKHYFVILDAKYYDATITEKDFKGIPGVGDIDKQQLYELAYKKFILDHDFHTANAFLFPSEYDDDQVVGDVKMPIFAGLNLCPVQLLMLPAMTIFSLYSHGNHVNLTSGLNSLFDKCKDEKKYLEDCRTQC